MLPRVYRLELEPSVALDTFRGSLTVELECSEDVSSFVLNAHSSLTLSVVLVDGVACAVKSSEQEELVVMLPAPGRPKVLFVSYVGTIGGDSIGLYRNTFSDKVNGLFSFFLFSDVFRIKAGSRNAAIFNLCAPYVPLLGRARFQGCFPHFCHSRQRRFCGSRRAVKCASRAQS